MKTYLKALFKALPVAGKLFWFGFGGLPILVGVLGTSYSICQELLPEQMGLPALPDAIPSFLGNILYGLVVTAACGIYGAFRLRKQRRRERLVQFGQRIEPPITKIEESLLQGGNGGRFYYIYSQWQETHLRKRAA